MFAKLIQNASPLSKSNEIKQFLVVLPKLDESLDEFQKKHTLFGKNALEALLLRRKMKPEEICGTPVSASLESGSLCVWVMVNSRESVFEQQTCIRKAVQLLLAENPEEVHLMVYGNKREKRLFAKLAVYTTWVNSSILPSRKTDNKKEARKPLSRISLYGHKDEDSFALMRASAEGNLLARELTILPPNELTPDTYRKQVKKIARKEGWKYQEFNLKKLRKMGAGAFVAVAQGSDSDDASIIHLQRLVGGSRKTVAFVGKGICFDTGGHNLKPTRFMHGMHEDMNGSAVALGILLAAAHANLKVNIDC